MRPTPRRKAAPSDRAKNDIIGIVSALGIVLERIHDAQTRHDAEVSPGTPTPRTFMLGQVEKYVKLAIAIAKKAATQAK